MFGERVLKGRVVSERGRIEIDQEYFSYSYKTEIWFLCVFVDF